MDNKAKIIILIWLASLSTAIVTAKFDISVIEQKIEFLEAFKDAQLADKDCNESR